MTTVSQCHHYPIQSDGATCHWCGNKNGTQERSDDLLLRDIERMLCDWDRPSQLATHDLWETIYKVAVLVEKYRIPVGGEDA